MVGDGSDASSLPSHFSSPFKLLRLSSFWIIYKGVYHTFLWINQWRLFTCSGIYTERLVSESWFLNNWKRVPSYVGDLDANAKRRENKQPIEVSYVTACTRPHVLSNLDLTLRVYASHRIRVGSRSRVRPRKTQGNRAAIGSLLSVSVNLRKVIVNMCGADKHAHGLTRFANHVFLRVYYYVGKTLW